MEKKGSTKYEDDEDRSNPSTEDQQENIPYSHAGGGSVDSVGWSSSKAGTMYYDVARDAWIRKNGKETVIVPEPPSEDAAASSAAGSGAGLASRIIRDSMVNLTHASKSSSGHEYSNNLIPPHYTGFSNTMPLRAIYSSSTSPMYGMTPYYPSHLYTTGDNTVINHHHKRSHDDPALEYSPPPHIYSTSTNNSHPTTQLPKRSRQVGDSPPASYQPSSYGQPSYTYPATPPIPQQPGPTPHSGPILTHTNVASLPLPNVRSLSGGMGAYEPVEPPAVTAAGPPAPRVTPLTPASRSENRIFQDLPLAIERDPITGIEYMSFRYTERGIKSLFRIRIDVDSVEVNRIPEDFKAANAVYPRANVPRHQYSGLRWEYESGANAIGFALAYLNRDVLAGRRGLLQRAVDSFRNRDPSQRSRRARRRERIAAEAARETTRETWIDPVNPSVGVEVGGSSTACPVLTNVGDRHDYTHQHHPHQHQ